MANVRLSLASFSLAVTVMGVGFAAAASATESCEDPESAKEWREMVREYPNDIPLHRLHALRIGICEKIERGSLDPLIGARLFEREKLELQQKRGEQEGRQRAY